MTTDERYMRRCLDLAAHGTYTTAPNPMVGAVIVAPDPHSPQGERIIGEGFHHRAGEPHAEVNALRSVHESDQHLLPQSTIYVSLEPCAHYGKTPPCASLLVRTGFRRCVIGCEDPFARVSGRGIAMLQEAGMSVRVGVLRDECLRLNRHFICRHTLRRPFITLKWASSADGFIDSHRQLSPTGDPSAPPVRLSTPRSLLRVHALRAAHQAILVGRRTFELDRPSLSVRHWSGSSPRRFVIGSVGEEALRLGFEVAADIDTLLDNLRREGLNSLLVEGGSQLLQSFIERDLWDEAFEEISNVCLHSGVSAPRMPHRFAPSVSQHFGVQIRHWESPVLQKNYLDF